MKACGEEEINTLYCVIGELRISYMEALLYIHGMIILEVSRGLPSGEHTCYRRVKCCEIPGGDSRKWTFPCF